MNKHNAHNPPEPGRLVHLKCEGRNGSYEVEGKFVGRLFLVRRPGGALEDDRFAWNECVEWEYADGK